MPTKQPPLLCELHAHTTWSDGVLSVRALCDLYGRSGFDVLAITDHVLRHGTEHVTDDNYDRYVAELTGEARRAQALYDLLVLPGLELTFDDDDPARAAHAVAVGLREFVGVGGRPRFRAPRTSARSSGTCAPGGRRTSCAWRLTSRRSGVRPSGR